MNIWDNFTHRDPSPIFDKSTGDVACDSYHKYKEDVQLLKNIGVSFAIFSTIFFRRKVNMNAEMIMVVSIFRLITTDFPSRGPEFYPTVR